MSNLEDIIEHIKTKDVVIRSHNFPDPDAIASSFGLQDLLLRAKNIHSTICYGGQINRSSTSKMLEILNIDTFNTDNMERLDKETLILVDAQIGNANIDFVNAEKILCIDHHPNYGDEIYNYSDIRPSIGACSSIIAEYYFENAIIPSNDVATALLYGIKIDTANLTRGVTNLDLDMFYLLYKQADLKKLNELESSNIQFEDLKTYMTAINTINVEDAVSFAGTENNCPEALIATISDFMLSISEVEFSVVYSIKEDGIKISTRSKGPEYDAGSITKEALKGIGSGGGHPFMAGGFVPTKTNGEELKKLIEDIKERFRNNVMLP